MQVMALVMVLWGIATVPTAQCVRDFKQDKIFLANALSFVPSMVVLLFLAKHGSGAMAFAWSKVVGQRTSCAVILFSAPKLYLPGMTRSALTVLYKFGVPLASANFIGYILQNVDYAFIGHLIGSVLLGTYVLAFNAASWSSSLLGGVLSTVSMPAFSRVKHDAVTLMTAMADGVRAVMLIAAPMCTLVMALSRPTRPGALWGALGGGGRCAIDPVVLRANFGCKYAVLEHARCHRPVKIRARDPIDMASRACSSYGDWGA